MVISSEFRMGKNRDNDHQSLANSGLGFLVRPFFWSGPDRYLHNSDDHSGRGTLFYELPQAKAQPDLYYI